MKTKLIAAAMAALIAVPSFCCAGIPEDKQKHIGTAAALDLGMEALGVKDTTRYCILGGLFIGKEIYDHNKSRPTHDHLGDMVADAGGVVLSRGVIWIVHKTF